MPEIVYLSGLPRSGSTLLCNLLAQHPEVETSPSTPLCHILQNCAYKPCGVVTHLPAGKCPPGTQHYCAVLEDIDLALFNKCVAQSFANRRSYRTASSVDFYQSQNLRIFLRWRLRA